MSPQTLMQIRRTCLCLAWDLEIYFELLCLRQKKLICLVSHAYCQTMSTIFFGRYREEEKIDIVKKMEIIVSLLSLSCTQAMKHLLIIDF